jgi:tetratricopeptide (TPR) repeat protein
MPTKKTQQKTVSIANAAGQKAAGKQTKKSNFMLYIYWVAIALFVAAACYMLARADKKGGIKKADNVQITDASAPADIAAPTVEQAPAPDIRKDEAAQYTESGKRKLMDGDAIGALNDFSLAIEKDPSALNYVFRGEVLMAGSNFDAAIADFDAAIRIDETLPAAHYDRALANIKLEKLTDALSDLDNAIRAQNANPDARDISAHDIYAKRAQVNLWLREWAAAENDYTAAISQTIGDLDYNDYTGRAEARTNNGKYQEAIADYVSAVTIISEKIKKTPDEKTRENMSRQAMGYFEKCGALRVKIGEMDLALQDLQAAHTLAIALDDTENKIRLEILISSIK